MRGEQKRIAEPHVGVKVDPYTPCSLSARPLNKLVILVVSPGPRQPRLGPGPTPNKVEAAATAARRASE